MRVYPLPVTQIFAPTEGQKTRAMQLVELERGIELTAYLREQYHKNGLRLTDIADALGVDTGTVSRWMVTLGIPRRVRTKANQS